jgi:O-antigen/teichoic acid export membrane protein
MFHKIKSKLDIHTLDVLIKSSKTMIVKVFGLIASLLTSIIVARTLGVEGVGIINLINQLGAVLLVFTLFGFRTVIVKYVSIAKSRQLYRDILIVIKTSLIFNGLLSICFAALGVFLLPVVVKLFSDNQELYYPLIIGFFMLIPQTYSRVYASALNGYGKNWQSSLVDQALSSILILIGLFIYWITEIPFTPTGVLLLYAISRIILLIIMIVLWKKTFSLKGKVNINLKPMLKMGLPMLLITGGLVITSNIDSLMLGSLSSLNDVGLYTIAAKLALLTSFFLAVSNTVLSPKIAALYDKNQINELSVMINKTTRFLLFIAIISLLIFIFFGKLILGLWSSDFVLAYPILILLSIGQFFNIATGCSGLLLVMTGHEKVQGYISGFSLILNIILNIILINLYGALGAAIATAITVALENSIKVILVKKYTGILTIG